MPATIDKFLGRPLNHKHNVSDIKGGSGTNIDTSTTTTITDNTTASNANVILVNALAKNITVILPQSSTVPSKTYKIKKIDTSNHTVTVDGFANETIDGDPTMIINFPNSAIQLVSSSTGWYIV